MDVFVYLYVSNLKQDMIKSVWINNLDVFVEKLKSLNSLSFALAVILTLVSIGL